MTGDENCWDCSNTVETSSNLRFKDFPTDPAQCSTQRHANPLENDYLDRGVGLVLSRWRWWSSPSHTPRALAHHERLVCDVLGYCGVPSHGVATEEIWRCAYFRQRSIHRRIARYDRRAHCRRNRAPQAFFASIIRDPLVASGVRGHPEVKTRRPKRGTGVEFSPSRADQAVAADRGRPFGVVRGIAVREGGLGG